MPKTPPLSPSESHALLLEAQDMLISLLTVLDEDCASYKLARHAITNNRYDIALVSILTAQILDKREQLITKYGITQ